MAVTENLASHNCLDPNDPYEKEFRHKSTRRSFTGAVYSAIGGASFIGVLTSVAGLLMGTTTVTIAGHIATGMAALVPMAPVIVGLVALGVLAVFLAERQFTELGCLRDEHAARKTAQAMAQEKARAKAQEKSAAVENDIVPTLSQPTPPDRRFTETIIQRSPAGMVVAGNEPKGFAETALASKEAAGAIARS